MDRQLMLVFSNAVEGREAEYAKWYDDVHIPEVLQVPGVVSGQRFARAEGSGAQSPQQFLTVYEIEGEPSEVMAGLGKAAQAGQMNMSDAIDLTSAVIWFFTAQGTKQEA